MFGIKSRVSQALGLASSAVEIVSPAQWQHDYRMGEWDRLNCLPEASRYSVIAGYCDVFNKVSILDVGCGEGLLAERLRHYPYERYDGFDLADAAIERARALRSDQRNNFSVARIEEFSTAAQYDLIVLNEVLYYVADPVHIVDRLAGHLSRSGHLLVSMYHAGRSKAVWKALESATHVVDSVALMHHSNVAWTIKLLSVKPR